MRFKEFKAGQVLRSGPTRVSEADIVGFARLYDPQWFHTDPQRAQFSRWPKPCRERLAHVRDRDVLACEGPLRDSDSIGSPGVDYLKWAAPVKPGDELRLEAEVIDALPSKNGHLGVLLWRWKLYKQKDVTVLELQVTSLFDLA